MDTFAFVIRFIHILSAVMWLGGNFLWGMIIVPNVMQRGPPPIRRPFLEAVLAKLQRYMVIAGALTIVSGFWVMGLITGWSDLAEGFQSGAWGISLGIGAVLGILMFLEGWFYIIPTGNKLLAAMQKMPAPAPGAPPAAPPPEIPALGKKLGIAGMVSMLLGFLALGAMVYAVNYIR